MKSSENLNGSFGEVSKEYEGVVEKYFPRQFKKNASPLKVLEIGCGFAHATSAIVEFVGSNLEYTGIDEDKHLVYAAALFNEELKSKARKVDFIAGDATTSEVAGEDNDMVILRNPQIFGSFKDQLTRIGNGQYGFKIDPNWEQILRNGVNSLKQGGFIFLTTPSFQEMEEAIRFISQQGMFNVLIHEPITPPLEATLTVKDEMVALIQKKL